MSGRTFRADDGRLVSVIDGFRDEVLRAAPQFTPKHDWDDEDYRAAARKRLVRAERTLETMRRYGVTLDGARVLEIGCGTGLDSLRIALEGVQLAVGIDRALPLLERDEAGKRVRRVARKVLGRLQLDRDVESVLQALPLRLATMDASWLAFPDASFDVVWSRTTLEHLMPLDRALAELARVLRPGGLVYHAIDPYYWVRGCHRPGVVDVPWAHARLSLAEYERFLSETEGTVRGAKQRRYLERLNRLTAKRWREVLEAEPFEIVRWDEERFPWVGELLERYPDVVDDRLEGVAAEDLTCCRIDVLLRRRSG